MKNIRKYINLSLLFVILGALILLTGCSKEDKSYDQTLILAVDDSKVYLDEMMYHVMLEEMYGQLYASYTGSAENYWSKENESGVTFGEAAKEVAMENAIRYELFYLLSKNEGYSLTEEEKGIAKVQMENIKKSVQPEQFQATQLSDEKLLKVLEKITLSTRYYNDFIAKLGIDELSIKQSMNVDDYKQYDIEYIYGTKQQYEELGALLESAKQAEDITTITSDSSLNSGKLSFVGGKDTFGEETNLEEIIIGMENGEVSDVIETVRGYYILKLKDNTSLKLYQEAVKEAMNLAIEDTFKPAYKALKEEHNIKIVKNEWKKITMGSETIPEQ